MYEKQRKQLNITKDSKLLIGLGDSFTEGQGALSQETWGKYKFSSDVRGQDLIVDDIEEELSNSWVNKLCVNHLKDYTPINFGFRGRGNKSAIKNLTSLNPDLNIEQAKEKIVILFATDSVRFDLLHPESNTVGPHYFWNTIWPHIPDKHTPSSIKKMWLGFREYYYNEMTAAIEFLMMVKELKDWCKLYGAKLILSSAFSQEYTKKNFSRILTAKHHKPLINIIDWENEFCYPEGYPCFTDILCKKENQEHWIGTHIWYQYAFEHGGTPKGWFTPCAHPSVKGHELIAKYLYKHIKAKGWYKDKIF